MEPFVISNLSTGPNRKAGIQERSRMPAFLWLVLVALPVISSAQVITSTALEVFPGTDSSTVIFDTTTISISSEALTVEIACNGFKKIHLIKVIEKGKDHTRYYLNEPKGIYYIEIRAEEPGQFVFIAYTNAPTQPIRYTNLKFH